MGRLGEPVRDYGVPRVAQPERHLRGSVSERLSARVAELEAVTARLLANEAKLIADSVTQDRLLGLLECSLEESIDEHRDVARRLTVMQGATFNSLAEFCGRSFWHRLRWLALGK
jgi:hypothetical protein